MKKVLFTLLDIIVVLIADLWCFWLVFYFSATVDGSIFITSPYAIFERNYLVPAQIFVIPIVITVISIALYRWLREKKLIGKKYIALVLFNIIPACINIVFQIQNFICYWNDVYHF